MNTHYIKFRTFFPDQLINEFGCAQYIIDKNVTEETNVCSPSYKIVCNEHRKDIARIDNHWTMNLYSLQNLGCFQIPRIQCEDSDIVAHLNIFMRDVLRVGTESTYKSWRILQYEKTDPQPTSLLRYVYRKKDFTFPFQT